MEVLSKAEQSLRRACATCGEIAYRNPQVLVNTIVAWHKQVLMCRRADPPAAGRWSLPGGFMECNETLEEAAARETREEIGIALVPADLRFHALVTLAELSEVYVGFIAILTEYQTPICGAECTDAQFFSEATLPWADLAYADIGVYLKLYFAELNNGLHTIHFGSLDTASTSSKAYRVSDIEVARWPRPHQQRAR